MKKNKGLNRFHVVLFLVMSVLMLVGGSYSASAFDALTVASCYLKLQDALILDQFPAGALQHGANTMLEHSLMQAGPHFQPTVNGRQTE